MSDSGIYIIRNLKNGKVYIGSAVDVDRRRKSHYTKLRGGYHPNSHLQNAWNKYGGVAFEWRVLIRCDLDDLLHYEQRAMDIYKEAIGWDMMYNIAPAAGSTLGMKPSAATRVLLSSVKKGNRNAAGHKPSSQARAKMSKSRPNGCLGRKYSKETRAKLSEAAKRAWVKRKAKC